MTQDNILDGSMNNKELGELFSKFVFISVDAAPSTPVLFTKREPINGEEMIGLTNKYDLEELKQQIQSLLKQAELRARVEELKWIAINLQDRGEDTLDNDLVKYRLAKLKSQMEKEG